MSKNKMPMKAQLHKLEFCPKFTELDRLSPIELMLIPQITSYVYCYEESCNEEYMISLALKLRLTDKSVVNSQQIRPAIINSALQK